MTTRYRQYPSHAHPEGYRARLALACGIGLMLGAGPAPAQDGFCSATATALLRACRSEVKDDFFVAQAICINVSDDEERRGCSGRARTARKEANKLCRRQRQGRLDACRSLGEGCYDPDFDPARFDDPRNPSNPNAFFPLRVGNRWEYGGAETVIVQVLNETKAIDGVRCIVVRDQVFEDGDLIEDTDDWFATAKDGDVWYCGEEVKDFESFAGDRPRLPELVSIDGSFKAGRSGDKPGIIFRAAPAAGEVYLEEFSLGNAEDMAEVLSTTYQFGADPALDEGVPRPLAERLCPGDCVVTRNLSLLEPGIIERKYYARGIGVFLEVKPDSGEIVQLTGCNFDDRCADLPAP
jgi:hypothetical protein